MRVVSEMMFTKSWHVMLMSSLVENLFRNGNRVLVAAQREVGAGQITAATLIFGNEREHLLEVRNALRCAAVTVWRLSQGLLDRSRAAGRITEERPTKERAWRRLLFLVDPQRRSGTIGPWTNPVMVKEFRCRRFGRSHWMLRLLALCAVASLALSCVAVLGVQERRPPGP